LTTQTFFDALVREDWDAAYAQVDPDSQAQLGQVDFRSRAQAYREGLGLIPAKVRVLTCKEKDNTAQARVLWIGKAGEQSRSRKDAITLHHGSRGWGVVLTSRFGVGRSDQ
jgi:hypothetical protein